MSKTSSTALASQTDTASPYELMMRAVSDPACDPAKLSALLAVRRDWMADEASAAFNRAVVQFQQECRIVLKGDEAYGGKRYARMDRIWREVRPLLLKCGLAVTWESVKSAGDLCVLDGHLRHAQGHAQALHHEMPLPDKLSGQNASQRAGAGETYCKRYATIAALGIQTGDDNDGHVEPPAESSAVTAVRKQLVAAGRDESKACAYMGVHSLEEATAAQISDLARMLAKAQPKDDTDRLM